MGNSLPLLAGRGRLALGALAWIVCIGCFLGGFAVETDVARQLVEPLQIGLFTASFIACPALWKMPPLSDMLDGKQRAMACIALLLSLPLVLMPAV